MSWTKKRSKASVPSATSVRVRLLRDLRASHGRRPLAVRQRSLPERVRSPREPDHTCNRGSTGRCEEEAEEGLKLTDIEAHRRMIFMPERFEEERNHIVAHYDDSPVRTADILPMVLDVLKVPAPPDGASSGDARRIPGELLTYGETGRFFVEADPELYLSWAAGKHRMVRSPEWKLVWIPGRKERSLTEQELEMLRSLGCVP